MSLAYAWFLPKGWFPWFIEIIKNIKIIGIMCCMYCNATITFTLLLLLLMWWFLLLNYWFGIVLYTVKCEGLTKRKSCGDLLFIEWNDSIIFVWENEELTIRIIHFSNCYIIHMYKINMTRSINCRCCDDHIKWHVMLGYRNRFNYLFIKRNSLSMIIIA